jgi:hypothetical protein
VTRAARGAQRWRKADAKRGYQRQQRREEKHAVVW